MQHKTPVVVRLKVRLRTGRVKVSPSKLETMRIFFYSSYAPHESNAIPLTR